MLSRDEILATTDFPTMTVKDVPIWGDVPIRALSGRRLEELESLIKAFQTAGKAKQSVRAFAVVHSVVDDAGVLFFKPEDMEKVSGQCGKTLDVIWEAVLEFNGMTKKSAETIAGN